MSRLTFRTKETQGTGRAGKRNQRGASFIELALILPILVTMLFAIIDLGRLIHARLIVTNVSREGGSLGSRDISTGNGLVTVLKSSSTPLDLTNYGRIWVTTVKAGVNAANQLPTINSRYPDGSFSGPGLNIASSVIGSVGSTPTGWITSSPLFNRLQFDTAQSAADISQVTVVEVFYFYTPITPLPNFMSGLFPNSFNINGSTRNGLLVSSRSVF